MVVAATQGFAQPYGLTLNLKRQTSWANLRDKLVSGELDAAHSLYGLIYAVHLGIGGVASTDMAVLMGLNQNGQSLNLSHGLQNLGVTSPEALDRHAHQSRAKLTFAQTFPTGTHAMWLYYWLASQGIHPLQDVEQRGGAAAANGRAPASRAHRWFLRRGTVGSQRGTAGSRFYIGDQPDHLARSPGEGSWLHPCLCRAIPQHRAGVGDGDP